MGVCVPHCVCVSKIHALLRIGFFCFAALCGWVGVFTFLSNLPHPTRFLISSVRIGTWTPNGEYAFHFFAFMRAIANLEAYMQLVRFR